MARRMLMKASVVLMLSACAQADLEVGPDAFTDGADAASPPDAPPSVAASDSSPPDAIGPDATPTEAQQQAIDVGSIHTYGQYSTPREIHFGAVA